MHQDNISEVTKISSFEIGDKIMQNCQSGMSTVLHKQPYISHYCRRTVNGFNPAFSGDFRVKIIVRSTLLRVLTLKFASFNEKFNNLT